MIASREKVTTRLGWARWSRWIGWIIGAVGALFVIRLFVRSLPEVVAAASVWRPSLLLVALACGLTAMTGIGLTWRTAVRLLGAEVGLLVALRAYFVGQLGKYVPGGVWAIMGRGEWARKEGVSGTAAYSSVFLSMGSAYLSALLLGVCLLALSPDRRSVEGVPFGALLMLLPLGFVLIHPALVRRFLTLLRRITGRELNIEVPSWSGSAWLVIRQIPSWILIGTATYLVAVSIGGSGGYANIVSAAAVSWAAGFLALPVPGGIGVREAVFVAMATSLPIGIAATVALAARLLFVAVDGLGAGTTTLLLAFREARVRG